MSDLAIDPVGKVLNKLDSMGPPKGVKGPEVEGEFRKYSSYRLSEPVTNHTLSLACMAFNTAGNLRYQIGFKLHSRLSVGRLGTIALGDHQPGCVPCHGSLPALQPVTIGLLLHCLCRLQP